MKSNEKKFSKTISALLIICALSFSTNTNAAPSLTFGSWFSNFFNYNNNNNYHRKKDKDREECGQPGGSTSVPLDGGLSILLIGATALGVKKLRGNKDEEI